MEIEQTNNESLCFKKGIQIFLFCASISVLAVLPVRGAMNDPFPTGYSMLNFGTILQGNTMSGRQPWTPACFVRDSVRLSLSSAYVNYYDAMDNLEDSDLRQAAIGFCLNFKSFCIKGSGTFFNAFGMYNEQKGFLSLGMSKFTHVQMSVEIEGVKAALRQSSEKSETILSAGFSLWVPWSFASFSFSCNHITLKDAHGFGFRQPLSLSAGLHTMPHRLGSQGVLLIFEPENKTSFRLCIGEEFAIYKKLLLCAGVSSKPLMVSIGIAFNMPAGSAYSAFVLHPILGWSKGVGMEYVKR